MIRLDDVAGAGGSWIFESPVATGQADRLADVVTQLEAADQHRGLGEWVVVVVAYEAAPAFDPSLRTADAPPDGIPFLWWQSFSDRTAAARLTSQPSHVASRLRRENRWAFPLAVDHIRERIAAGDVYQVNLTDRFEGAFTGSPLATYEALIGVQSCAFGAYVDMGSHVIASASPELFFSWSSDSNTITCRPMKGTAARHPRAHIDRLTGEQLLASEKDRAENVMIVDLLRNDLSRIALTGTVQVPTLFSLERYETVWQLTSTVQAEVDPTTGLLDVFRALFPCGSVTGAPKFAAMRIIAEMEADPRGVYCGAIGVLAPDGEQPRAVFSVPIRTAVLDPASHTFEYGSGGGITWSSDAAAEDAEVVAKTRILTRSRREFDLLETLRLDATGAMNLELHLDRLEATAEWFARPFHRADCERLIADLPPPAVPCRLRVLVNAVGEVTVEQHPLTESSAVVRLAIDTVITRSDDPFCCHKTTWRRHYQQALARHAGADDVVLVNELGNAIETTIANLAYRIDHQWFCPPLGDGGLPGVGREVALGKRQLVERSIAAADLHRCDELAVINALRGWRTAELMT
ncbi:MAG TPA: chorismate-binding protein [Ilumatobacter sp.]|nr:chorismate-binding protein [Ilumatobacter sp.]